LEEKINVRELSGY